MTQTQKQYLVQKIEAEIKPDAREVLKNIKKLTEITIDEHLRFGIQDVKRNKRIYNPENRRIILQYYLKIEKARRVFIEQQLKPDSIQLFEYESDIIGKFGEANLIKSNTGPGIICGHYDTVVGSPGVFDNSLSICMMMELSKFIPASFIFFGGEELPDVIGIDTPTSAQFPKLWHVNGRRGSKIFASESKLNKTFAIAFDAVYSTDIVIDFCEDMKLFFGRNPLIQYSSTIQNICSSFGFNMGFKTFESDHRTLSDWAAHHESVGIGPRNTSDYHETVDILREPFDKDLNYIPNSIDKEFIENYVKFAAMVYYSIWHYSKSRKVKQ